MIYRRRITRKRRRMGPEHRIQRDIMCALRLHRCSVMRANAGTIKTRSGSYFKGMENGTPDLIGYRWQDKQIFFIEVKAPNGIRSELQKYRIEQLTSQGFTAFFCDNYDFFKTQLNKLSK